MDEAALIKLMLSILDDYVRLDAHTNLKEDNKEDHITLNKEIQSLKDQNQKILWLLITSLVTITIDFLLKGGIIHGGS